MVSSHSFVYFVSDQAIRINSIYISRELGCELNTELTELTASRNFSAPRTSLVLQQKLLQFAIQFVKLFGRAKRDEVKRNADCNSVTKTFTKNYM